MLELFPKQLKQIHSLWRGQGGVQVILGNYIFPVGRVKMVSQMILNWLTETGLFFISCKSQTSQDIDIWTKKNVMFFFSQNQWEFPRLKTQTPIPTD